MTKDSSMRKLLADKVRLWMTRAPEADTQAKLAARAKMSQSSVHRVLFMDTEPELATAHKLAAAFGITVSELLADETAESMQVALPFEAKRYAALPPAEREKIRAFAEFVIATHEASTRPALALETVSETIEAKPEERAMVERVAQRNLTTDTLSTHETSKDKQKKPANKRSKSISH
ncbi:helix-turn-helix transcriptional regulator [Paraburkholderia bryophila]|uniref:helix-turn-helix domain-containing protein n=1 Tax=Paraburkholderia bryophila TaxID=420952 RepID=UPI0038BCA724